MSDNSRKWVVEFVNLETGEVERVDYHTLRIRRMVKRVKDWARYIPDPSEADYIGITLTYAPQHKWEKEHISDYMRLVHYRLKRNLFGYCWVAEVQERGAVHYHVLLIVRKGTRLPKPDESGMWKWGASSIQLIKNPTSYLVDYLRKASQKMLPYRGMRMFAVVWKDFFCQGIRKILRFLSLPSWLREQITWGRFMECFVLPVRVKGVGWVWLGQVFKSPWKVSWFPA